MKTIRITPGLGNQMFQYAFLLNYKLRGEKISFDISPCLHSKKHNAFELEKIFGIKEHILTIFEKVKINGPYFYIKEREITFIKLINKIIQKLFGEKFILNTNKYIIEKEANLENNFNQQYLNLKGDKYFSGYFCSSKYFEDIKDEVKRVFTFPKIKAEDKNNFDILEKIKNSESISIHVRRGDYVNTNLDVCNKNYFEKSFRYIQNILIEERNILKENIKVFIFSDDINWCKDNFNFVNDFEVNYVDWNKKENSYKDMQLMSECKHNIISNSTFSWWAACMNQNEPKIVISPKWWTSTILMSHFRCVEGWELV